MSAAPKTMKIKSSHPSQGDHIVINAEDYDPAVHEVFDAATDAAEAAAWQLAKDKADAAAEIANKEQAEADTAAAAAEEAAAAAAAPLKPARRSK